MILDEKISKSFKSMLANVNDGVVKAIIQGDLYADHRTLSERVWNITNEFGAKVQDVVAKGMLQQKSAVESAKDLRSFVKPPEKRPLSWRGSFEDYKTYHANWNAKRLARTAINHSYQTATIQAVKNNPYVSGILWQTAGDHRVCDLCQSREGKVFPVDDVPMDHPNGRCTMVPNIEKSLDDISKELNELLYDVEEKPFSNWEEGVSFIKQNNSKTKLTIEFEKKGLFSGKDRTKYNFYNGLVKTSSEAEEFAKKVLKLQQTDYSNVHVDVANMINQEIEKAYFIFGNLHDKGVLNGVRAYSKKADFEAFYSATNKIIWLRNVEFQDSLKLWGDIAKEEFDDGYWSTPFTEHQVRHENGHAVQNFLFVNDKSKVRIIRDMKDDVFKKIGITGWNEYEDVKIMREARKYLSYYGLSDEKEFVSEAIAEYLGGNPRIISRQVINVLLKGVR